MTGFTTRAVHGAAGGKDIHGALRTPVYDTAAFAHESSLDIQLAFEGKKAAHSYSRISNPTVSDFEQRLRLLAGARGVLALASGMAAISNLALVIAGAGRNIVTSRYLFGNTLSLFQHTLGSWGLETRFVDMTRPGEVAAAIDSNTCALFLEAITNPQLEVADFTALGAIAAEHQVPLVVDTTMVTPYLFPAAKFGVAVEVLSSTKYISGGATSIGGAIIDTGVFDWRLLPGLRAWAEQVGPMALLAALRRETFRNLGACLAPHNAYLQTLGLETLSLRIDRSCENALDLARFLGRQPQVVKVNYPGLTESPFHQLARRQFGGRFGGVLTFALADRQSCFTLMDTLSLIRRATNINDNKTLILHPASTLFCEFSAAEKEEMEVTDNMVRLSVGIEDVEDLKVDLLKGLARL